MDFRAALRSEVERARREAASAEARYRLLVDTLAKYERTLRQSATAPMTAVVSGGGRARRQLQRQNNTTKISRIRAVLNEYGAKGVTAPQMVSALGKLGVEISVNGVHAAFSKLKAAKLVRSKSGRYSPTNRATQSNTST